MDTTTFRISVNQNAHIVEADPATPLLYILRNTLEINGPRFGCGMAQCGACMVLIDGKPAELQSPCPRCQRGGNYHTRRARSSR